MKKRTNKLLESAVIKGLELSVKGDNFSAMSFMKDQGVPNSVIARVLYQHDQIRSCDLSVIQQLSN